MIDSLGSRPGIHLSGTCVWLKVARDTSLPLLSSKITVLRPIPEISSKLQLILVCQTPKGIEP